MPSASGLPAYGAMPGANVYNGSNRNPNLSYDAAGNQTALGALALSYDAENRQIAAADSLEGVTGSYQYVPMRRTQQLRLR